jgi:hypothetical protein
LSVFDGSCRPSFVQFSDDRWNGSAWRRQPLRNFHYVHLFSEA